MICWDIYNRNFCSFLQFFVNRMSLLGYLILTYANLNATTQFKVFDICKLFVRICDSFSLEMENKCALIHNVLTPTD